MSPQLRSKDEEDLVQYSTEDTRKNPISINLRLYTGTIPIELLGGVVARARDFFHSFIALTLRRKYRRAVPIYLVDDWVVNALGVFMSRGQRVLPGNLDSRPFSPSSNLGGMRPLIELFDAFRALRQLLNGARLLTVDEPMRELAELVGGIAAGNSDLERLESVASLLGDLITRAVKVMSGDMFVRPYVDPVFVQELLDAIRRLVVLARRASEVGPRTEVPGIGFGPGRPSGVLFGSIPALKIEGPAILIAPGAVCAWAAKFTGLEEVTRDINRDYMQTWFGVVEPFHRAAAVGMANVIHHELLHAMIALPNDAVQSQDDLFRARWRFYEKREHFEEGLCDAAAAVATGITLLKAQFKISGRRLPVMHRGKYAGPWERVFPALRETYVDYHGPATDRWIHAWEANNRDFGAFSGLVKLYSTNFRGIDWDHVFEELSAGRISTGR